VQTMPDTTESAGHSVRGLAPCAPAVLATGSISAADTANSREVVLMRFCLRSALLSRSGTGATRAPDPHIGRCVQCDGTSVPAREAPTRKRGDLALIRRREGLAACRSVDVSHSTTLASLSHRPALVLAGFVGLALAATRGAVAATCPSTCTAQLAKCKRTCGGGGQARRDCREACAARSTCTARGAHPGEADPLGHAANRPPAGSLPSPRADASRDWLGQVREARAQERAQLQQLGGRRRRLGARDEPDVVAER